MSLRSSLSDLRIIDLFFFYFSPLFSFLIFYFYFLYLGLTEGCDVTSHITVTTVTIMAVKILSYMS